MEVAEKVPAGPWKPFLACLQGSAPFADLKNLKKSLISQGCSQHYIYDIFSSFLQHCIDTELDTDGPDGTSPADTVRDILDGVVGWCARAYWSFPDRPYYNPQISIGMTREKVAEEFNGKPDTVGAGNLKDKIWVYGLHEYYFNKEGKLEGIYHRGENEGSWNPMIDGISKAMAVFDNSC